MSTPAITTRTFLLTDIEGSTQLMERHEAVMRRALAQHDTLAAGTLAPYGGEVVKPRGEGDSLFIVFPSAAQGLAGALALQRAFHAPPNPWPVETPIKVRMALLTGEAEFRDNDYYGRVVNRCARLRAIAHGGQVLVSHSTQVSVTQSGLPEQVALHDMGRHLLKDLEQPEQVFQLLHPDLPADFPPLKSLDATKHNLPIQRTSFVGRTEEIPLIGELLQTSSLLTLTGPGGAGKTRLALQVAAEQVERFPDGVWLVKLDTLSKDDGPRLPQAIASALSLKDEPNRPLLETLHTFLRTKSLLLILDNCEHLIEASAEIARSLCDSCGSLKILATSREPLNLGEPKIPVEALGRPVARVIAPERLNDYDATRLFLERARLARPQFEATAQNALYIMRICEELDGIPLLIELAAARVDKLSLDVIARELRNVLTSSRRDDPDRHKSAEAVIRWSYDLLALERQRLLRRLSVFVGGFTLEAAQNICRDEEDDDLSIMERLTQLVDRSLVRVEENADGTYRYRLLHVVRGYSLKRLTEASELQTFQAHHCDYFLRLAEKAEPELQGAEQAHWLTILETEHDNFRAALKWSGHSEESLRIAGAIHRFWMIRGHLNEGRNWLKNALTNNEQATFLVRFKALNGAGILAWYQNDFEAATCLYTKALELAREVQDKSGVARLLNNLGLTLLNQAKYAEAGECFEESLKIYQELGDGKHQVAVWNSQAMLMEEQRKYGAAYKLISKSVAFERKEGKTSNLSIYLHNLGELSRKRKNFCIARGHFQESLAIRVELENRPGVIYSLLSLAQVAFAMKQWERAILLFTVAETQCENISTPIKEEDKSEYQTTLAKLKKELGIETFTTLWQRGKLFSLDDTILYALETCNS